MPFNIGIEPGFPARVALTSFLVLNPYIAIAQSIQGTATADDRAKYTIEFAAAGRLTARIDCNRGAGGWKSSGAQIQFGPLALTRAQCPAGSLHDQIVKHGPTSDRT